MTENTTTRRIDLAPATEYRRETYGVILTSITRHSVTGARVHNRHHPHRLDVWENRDGRDPKGAETTERYSYLLSAEAIAITAHRESRPPEGDALHIGDRVDLYLADYCLGTFEVKARPLSDPHLELVD